MNRRLFINLIAVVVVVVTLFLFGRTIQYQPARTSHDKAPSSEVTASEGDASTEGGAVSEGETDGGAATVTPGGELASAAALVRHAEIGFQSPERQAEHFEKHGAEFGGTTADGYLLLAQALRDRPAGGEVLEKRRKDGVVARFDRASGSFLAFDPDFTIRTFFRPNDGEAYFLRQGQRD